MLPQGPLKLSPLPKPPTVQWPVPGSKSITNRALILAAMAEGESLLEGALESDDTRHMQRCLGELGIHIENLADGRTRVLGGLSRLKAPSKELFVGNSGTTVRFLAALAIWVPGKVTLCGDENMARRPIADLVEGLTQLGVEVSCPSGCPPLTITGNTLTQQALTVKMRGDKSSQYFSALLMALTPAKAEVRVEIVGELVSRPYVEVTSAMVKEFGGSVETDPSGFLVRPGGYVGRKYLIEPDASSASYPFALAAASRGSVGVPGLQPGALQGDYGFVEVLRKTGARIEAREGETIVHGAEAPRGVHVDMHHISDTVMSLAAIAPIFSGKTRIENVANIRIKETDRLAATVAELERLGQKVTSGQDWLEVEPRPVRSGVVHCYDDHRMAMSFAILGLVRDGISIEDPACVSKTYPGFWDALALVYRAQGQRVPWQAE